MYMRGDGQNGWLELEEVYIQKRSWLFPFNVVCFWLFCFVFCFLFLFFVVVLVVFRGELFVYFFAFFKTFLLFVFTSDIYPDTKFDNTTKSKFIKRFIKMKKKRYTICFYCIYFIEQLVVRKGFWLIEWVSDCLRPNVNPCRVILCQETKESRSLYIYIYILCVVVLKRFFCTVISSIPIQCKWFAHSMLSSIPLSF